MNDITKWQVSNSPSTILNNLKTAILADGGTVDEVLLRNEYLDLHSTIKKQASLVVAGGAYKSGTVYGYNPQTSALIPFTFTRTGATATRVNKDGLIETVAANVPRMDYDPLTKRFKGLLMEKGSQNLWLRSEEFDNAVWSKSRSTITPNAISSPDGTLNADKLIGDGVSVGNRFAQQDIAVTSGTTYTTSYWVKAAEITSVMITFLGTNSAFGSVKTAIFNLSNGTITSSDTLSATISSFSDGWYRVSASLAASATVTGQIAIGTSTSFSGTEGFYLWAAQLEASAYPTSYIPTAGSAVTRGQDVCSANVGAWYNAAEGTLQAVWMQNGQPDSGVFTFSDGTLANRIRDGVGNGFSGLQVVNGNVTQADIFASGILKNTLYKSSNRYLLNSFARALNGTIVNTDSSGTLPTITKVYLGNGANGLETMDGWIKGAAYFSTGLANSDLQAITT